MAELIRDALAEIDGGRPALVATRRVYRRLAALAGNRFLAEMHADVELAIERNLMGVGADESARRHVRDTLHDLDAAIKTGDVASAVDAAIRQHSEPRTAG